MYGQTEATARLSYLPPERAEDKAGSIGIAIPGVELRVVDEHGRELPPGEVGELVARGANVTPGYLDEPEETAAILHDGWLWTGDLAERDADGFFFHRGRAKEILKIGGHRVSPIEIEQVIARHPDVAEAAVVGREGTTSWARCPPPSSCAGPARPRPRPTCGASAASGCPPTRSRSRSLRGGAAAQRVGQAPRAELAARNRPRRRLAAGPGARPSSPRPAHAASPIVEGDRWRRLPHVGAVHCPRASL